MVQLIGFSSRLRMVFDTVTVVASAISHKTQALSTQTQSSRIQKQTYENAVMCLNMLQSNAMTVQQSIQRPHNQLNENVKMTEKFLERSGVTLCDLDQLRVIHVSGSKGKGSTCAFTESILRSFGIKTGFFSSPHLVCVTERIRINGEPISRSTFNKYFWRIYNLLDRFKEQPDDMPAYFKFLTILSLHIFLAEKVDVAIIEVGIGGEYDCTNVMRNTQVAGITSLGIEHTKILGNTLAEIAWQKAGIMKHGTCTFTVPQHNECIQVLHERAIERNATLSCIPEFDAYTWPRLPNTDLLNNNKIQRLNASLAIQLAYSWLRKNPEMCPNKKFDGSDELCLNVTDDIVQGLEQCIWNGRFQVCQLGNLRIFIDGAHTMESLSVCIDWFKEHVQNSSSAKYLLFNATGDRDTKKMLQLLYSRFEFDVAVFSPNISLRPFELKDTNYVANPQNKCHYNAEIWQRFHTDNGQRSNETEISTKHLNGSEEICRVFVCTTDALDYIRQQSGENKNIDLLVTGSIHLVGATLNSIERFKEAMP